MPFAEQPGAYWLLLSPEGYEFRHTTYDQEIAAKEIRSSSDPQAQEFVDTYILNVWSEAKGIEMFEEMEKKQRFL